MTEPMIALCGLDCAQCPALLATLADDRVKAQETAELWKRQFGLDLTVDQLWCDGCLAPGRKSAHCAECKIRACALERHLSTCAPCDEYPCRLLSEFFEFVPDAKTTLDQIRNTL
jgi:hypothetical protein